MIRNITGYAETENGGGGYFNAFSGALKGSTSWTTWPVSRVTGTQYSFYKGVKIDVSNTLTTSTEIRPINISAIPLIVAI